MRLGEWQQYLETEFLDSEEPDSPSDEDSWIPQTSLFASTSPIAPASFVPDPTPPFEQFLPEARDAVVHTRRTPGAYRRVRVRRNTPEPAAPHSGALNLDSIHLNHDVPRHVRLLLALGKRECESEVAQSSYKRPFQETRSELIARLLDPVLSLEDAARLLNVCPTTVRRYTNRGLLNYYRKQTDRAGVNGVPDRETRQRRFRLSDILTFLEAQEATPISMELDSDANVEH